MASADGEHDWLELLASCRTSSDMSADAPFPDGSDASAAPLPTFPDGSDASAAPLPTFPDGSDASATPGMSGALHATGAPLPTLGMSGALHATGAPLPPADVSAPHGGEWEYLTKQQLYGRLSVACAGWKCQVSIAVFAARVWDERLQMMQASQQLAREFGRPFETRDDGATHMLALPFSPALFSGSRTHVGT